MHTDRLRKRLIYSLGTGAILTAVGIGLIALGGWGPCGPASGIAMVGGMLSIEHTILWFRIFPGLEESGVLPDVISLFLFPFFDFALITYILLTVIFMFKTRKPAPRDG